MAESKVLQRVRERFGAAIIDTHSALGQDTVIVSKSAIVELARFLKEDPELQFNVLLDLTAVDHWKRKPRFEVVYHLLSLANRSRLRVKAPVGGADPELETLSALWPNANWYEREVWDMFGIRFKGHPDLRRLLLYPEFEGHPLRKDYPVDKRQPRIGPQD